MPYDPVGRPGMIDVGLLSEIPGLSFDSSFLSPLVFLPGPLALSVLSFSADDPFF